MSREDMDQWEERRNRERRERRTRHGWEEDARDGAADDRAEGDGSRHRRKERVLHTRISEELHGAIRRAADDLRVPVSNLVRNALEDVFRAVDDVSETVSDFVGDVVSEVEDIRTRIREERAGRTRDQAPSGSPFASRDAPIGGEAPSAADTVRDAGTPEGQGAAGFVSERPAFEDVAGWQPLILNRAQTCADCGRPVPALEQAYLGVSSSGRPPIYLCQACLGARGA